MRSEIQLIMSNGLETLAYAQPKIEHNALPFALKQLEPGPRYVALAMKLHY